MRIPFGLWPYSWGLKGKARDIAEAEYYFEGEELARTLAHINCYGNDNLLSSAMRDINLEYGHLTKDEYDREVAVNDLKGDEQVRELLRLDLKEEVITPLAHDKQLATLDGEPWVNVIAMKMDKDHVNEGAFELDWNDKFIEQLEDAGYLAPKEEEIVDQWFNDVCRNIAITEYGGVGNFDEDMKEDMEEERRRLGESGRKIKE